MILSRKEIIREIENGEIIIEPFDIACLNTNGYDFHLEDRILEISSASDVKEKDFKESIVHTLPDAGFIIEPKKLYLGLTLEKIKSNKYSQFLFGDRSIGSLGVWVNISAPLGHVGSCIRWTLEITTVSRCYLYPKIKFGRVVFLKNNGIIDLYGSSTFDESGKYLTNDIQLSKKNLDQDL